MDNFAKKLESKERAKFNLAQWQNRFSEAQTSRSAWDSDAEICRKIRDNELPTRGKINNAEGFTDKFYIDNWIFKSCFWKTSLLMGYSTYLDLKSIDNNPYDTNREILEAEINFAADRIGLMRKLPQSILDWQYFGVGASYLQWNKYAIDNAWQTGKPEVRYFDSRNIWVDPGVEQPDWSDMRYLFALSLMDVEDAKERFPKYADKIHGYVSNYNYAQHIDTDIDKLDVYLVQYKKKYRIKQISIFNTSTNETQVFPFDDYQEMIENGQELPETMIVGDMFEAETDVWFQFFYSDTLATNLSEPEYVGKRNSFAFLLNNRIDKDVFPRGIVWYLKDLQEISVIIMTLLTISAVKLNKATPYMEEGALKDEEDFIYNRDKLNYVGTIDATWREQHPQQQPITWDRPELRPDLPIALNNLITESIKTASGAIDSARGEAQYSGQSGAQTAQLQAAASVFTKLDEIAWHNYLRDLGEKLKDDIANYKTSEHVMYGIADEGVVVNPGNVSQFNPDMYFVEPYVDSTPEVMKEVTKDRFIQLNQAGKISTIDMLTELNIPNAQAVYDRAMEENQILQIAQILKENPEVAQEIQKFVQQNQQSENIS